MSAQHTPGPWHVEDGALTKGNEQPTGWFICHPKTECDATALAWVEREADALMFAAAPELLEGAQDTVEALKLLRTGLMNGVIDAAKMTEVIDAHIDELTYAIAKATGQ